MFRTIINIYSETRNKIVSSLGIAEMQSIPFEVDQKLTLQDKGLRVAGTITKIQHSIKLTSYQITHIMEIYIEEEQH